MQRQQSQKDRRQAQILAVLGEQHEAALEQQRRELVQQHAEEREALAREQAEKAPKFVDELLFTTNFEKHETAPRYCRVCASLRLAATQLAGWVSSPATTQPTTATDRTICVQQLES